MTASSKQASPGLYSVGSTFVLVVLVVVVLVGGFSTASSLDLYGWDFRVQYFRGAEAVTHGESPYPPTGILATDSTLQYVYPPLTAVVLVPVTLLPEDVAVALSVLVALAMVGTALALVGLRDARCYLAVLASAPTWNLMETANLTAALVLAAALAWRLRASMWPLAATLGLAIAAKLLLWPMLAWTAATRRGSVAPRGLSITAVATLGSWAVIGFDGVADYPALARELSDVWSSESYSLVGMAAALGFDETVGRAWMLVVGGALLAGCVAFGRTGDDRRSFTCSIAAALALTPIVWVHYMALLFVPLAIARPRFSIIWLLPLALWLCPRLGNGDGLEPFVPALVAALLLVVMLARPRREGVLAEAT